MVEFYGREDKCTVDIGSLQGRDAIAEYLFYNTQLFGPDGWTKLQSFNDTMTKEEDLDYSRNARYTPRYEWWIDASSDDAALRCPLPVTIYFDNRTKAGDTERAVQLSIGQLVIPLPANQTGMLTFPFALNDENAVVKLDEKPVGIIGRRPEKNRFGSSLRPTSATYLLDTSGARAYVYHRIFYSKGGKNIPPESLPGPFGSYRPPPYSEYLRKCLHEIDGRIDYFLKHAPDSITMPYDSVYESRAELNEEAPPR